MLARGGGDTKLEDIFVQLVREGAAKEAAE